MEVHRILSTGQTASHPVLPRLIEVVRSWDRDKGLQLVMPKGCIAARRQVQRNCHPSPLTGRQFSNAQRGKWCAFLKADYGDYVRTPAIWYNSCVVGSVGSFACLSVLDSLWIFIFYFLWFLFLCQYYFLLFKVFFLHYAVFLFSFLNFLPPYFFLCSSSFFLFPCLPSSPPSTISISLCLSIYSVIYTNI